MGKDQWNDWRWQLRNSIRTLDQLQQHLNLTEDEIRGVEHAASHFRMAITPYFLRLADRNNPNCPIRKQFVPTIQESYVSPFDMVDPCGEDSHTPVPGRDTLAKLPSAKPKRLLKIISAGGGPTGVKICGCTSLMLGLPCGVWQTTHSSIVPTAGSWCVCCNV